MLHANEPCALIVLLPVTCRRHAESLQQDITLLFRRRQALLYMRTPCALEAPGSPVPHSMRDAVHILKAHRFAVLGEEPVLVLVDRLPPFPFVPHRPCIGVCLSRVR